MARAPDDIHHLYPRLDEKCAECFDSRHPIRFEQSHAGTVRLLVRQHIPLTVWELGSNAGIHSPHSHGLEACYKMKPTESRKSNKPIMEKRRRARINQCLNELKTLILEALRKDPSRHSKLEKADILEMTVKYLQNLQRQQMALTMATNPQIMSKYRAGFGECVAEVSRFLSGSPAVDTAVQQRLISHLTSNLNGLEPINDDQVNLGIPMSSLSTAEFRRQCRGLQLIPTRLPGGEVLFFVPSNSPFVSSYSSSVSLTPSTEPLSIQVSPEQEIEDDKNAPCTDVAQDLSTKLSVSSSGSDSPQTPADEDESGASGDPWRPW